MLVIAEAAGLTPSGSAAFAMLSTTTVDVSSRLPVVHKYYELDDSSELTEFAAVFADDDISNNHFFYDSPTLDCSSLTDRVRRLDGSDPGSDSEWSGSFLQGRYYDDHSNPLGIACADWTSDDVSLSGTMSEDYAQSTSSGYTVAAHTHGCDTQEGLRCALLVGAVDSTVPATCTP